MPGRHQLVIDQSNVSGFEKRGNFVQNAKFWHFSSYHHFKAVRASDFILGLGAHQANGRGLEFSASVAE